MDDDTADVIVIGMGPGGEDVAGQLAEAGLDVIGIEAELVGGECPYWGCIPSKMMIRAAHALAEARRVTGLAGTASVSPDWSPVAQRIRDEATDDWDDRVAVERFTGKGGRFVRGRGRITGRGTVAVGDREFTATTGIVVAAGTTAAIPPIPGLGDVDHWTNRDAVAAPELPASLVVLGGGAIGLEIAQTYARFGVDVSIIEAQDRLAPLEEPEVGDALTEVFEAEGIDVHVGSRAVEVADSDAGITVTLDGGASVTAERLLVATGRRIDLAAVGLDTVGVDATLRSAPVDEHLRVTEGVWAVGDITGKGAFTHVAVHQAAIVVADILDLPTDRRVDAALSRVTFTDPEIGSVGLSEAEAREAGIDVAVATKPIAHTARGWIHRSGNEGIIKLVADRSSGVLVGATAMGPSGGEVLGMLSLAVHARVPIETIRTMVLAYPTFHRGISDTLDELSV